MSKFKVGDRVRVLDNKTRSGIPISKYVVGKEYDVTDICFDGEGNEAVVLLGHSQYLRADQFELVPALTLRVGKFYKTRAGEKVGPLREQDGYLTTDGMHYAADGECCYLGDSGRDARPDHDLVAEWGDEPAAVAPATAAEPEVEITGTLDFTTAPAVGDNVLIPGWITSINHSPKGTHYAIAFETANRRVSLHFTEEDFIVDEDDGDCPCFAENDNGPLPHGGDSAKAFDALGDWLRALTVNPSAVFQKAA